MAMTACYSNYGLLGAVSQRQRHQQQQTQHPQPLIPLSMPQTSRMQSAQVATLSQAKDFSVPLHVDCSVEYELPNSAKPPPVAPGARVEPLLLMIHPMHFRKIESEQRRSPFINNMPSMPSSSSRNSSSSSRRSSRNSQQTQSQSQTQPSITSATAAAAAAAAAAAVVQQHHSNQSQNQQTQLHHSHSHSHSHQQQQQHHHHHHHNHHSHSQSMERQKLEQQHQQSSQINQHQQRSLSQQQQKQQTMSQMSQQAYYPANSNNNTNPSNISTVIANNASESDNSSLADIRLCLDNWEHSQMAAIPRDFQAPGLPDATPNNSYRDDKLNALNGKYRQYLRSHRLHPYLMASATFPQLTSSVYH